MVFWIEVIEERMERGGEGSDKDFVAGGGG